MRLHGAEVHFYHCLSSNSILLCLQAKHFEPIWGQKIDYNMATWSNELARALEPLSESREKKALVNKPRRARPVAPAAAAAEAATDSDEQPLSRRRGDDNKRSGKRVSPRSAAAMARKRARTDEEEVPAVADQSEVHLQEVDVRDEKDSHVESEDGVKMELEEDSTAGAVIEEHAMDDLHSEADDLSSVCTSLAASRRPTTESPQPPTVPGSPALESVPAVETSNGQVIPHSPSASPPTLTPEMAPQSVPVPQSATPSTLASAPSHLITNVEEGLSLSSSAASSPQPSTSRTLLPSAASALVRSLTPEAANGVKGLRASPAPSESSTASAPASLGGTLEATVVSISAAPASASSSASPASSTSSSTPEALARELGLKVPISEVDPSILPVTAVKSRQQVREVHLVESFTKLYSFYFIHFRSRHRSSTSFALLRAMSTLIDRSRFAAPPFKGRLLLHESLSLSRSLWPSYSNRW
jgi:hypothetical protein